MNGMSRSGMVIAGLAVIATALSAAPAAMAATAQAGTGQAGTTSRLSTPAGGGIGLTEGAGQDTVAIGSPGLGEDHEGGVYLFSASRP
jgi:hypothetical protein